LPLPSGLRCSGSLSAQVPSRRRWWWWRLWRLRRLRWWPLRRRQVRTGWRRGRGAAAPRITAGPFPPGSP
jgi:hypothetical protein